MHSFIFALFGNPLQVLAIFRPATDDMLKAYLYLWGLRSLHIVGHRDCA